MFTCKVKISICEQKQFNPFKLVNMSRLKNIPFESKSLDGFYFNLYKKSKESSNRFLY